MIIDKRKQVQENGAVKKFKPDTEVLVYPFIDSRIKILFLTSFNLDYLKN